jgi:enoyl-CoA hydratase/carnithine racemase
MAAWGTESGHIDVTVRDDVAVVTLRRPDKLNALTADACRELAAILRHFGTGEVVRGRRGGTDFDQDHGPARTSEA